MKKIIISSLILSNLIVYSQKFSDLKFETIVPDTENHYIVLPVKEGDKSYNLGFMYFDETAGYTLDYIGDLHEEEGILKFKEREDAKNSSMKVRIENLSFKSAIISNEMLKQFNLPMKPEWLKNYLSTKPENEKILKRASIMNGANFPQIALPKLLELHKNNFKTESLYFELAFSYNALGKFAEAETVCDEAVKNKKTNDFIFKEYIYSLVHQNKLKEADTFIAKNSSSYKNEANKIESMINLVALSAHNNNFIIAEKWLKELKTQPNINRYQRNIDQLESVIKEKKSKIQ